MFTPMTDAEKKKLEKMKDVLDGFENFLISLGDSDQNRKQVLRQARKMLSGQGVEHPRNNAFFRRNEPVHLGCDFGQLIEDAWDFENTYGEDSSTVIDNKNNIVNKQGKKKTRNKRNNNTSIKWKKKKDEEKDKVDAEDETDSLPYAKLLKKRKTIQYDENVSIQTAFFT